MSQYPTCKHGHSDPNFDCLSCENERKHENATQEIFDTRKELGNALERISELQNELDKLRVDLAEIRFRFCTIANSWERGSRAWESKHNDLVEDMAKTIYQICAGTLRHELKKIENQP